MCGGATGIRAPRPSSPSSQSRHQTCTPRSGPHGTAITWALNVGAVIRGTLAPRPTYFMHASSLSSRLSRGTVACAHVPTFVAFPVSYHGGTCIVRKLGPIYGRPWYNPPQKPRYCWRPRTLPVPVRVAERVMCAVRVDVRLGGAVRVVVMLARGVRVPVRLARAVRVPV